MSKKQKRKPIRVVQPGETRYWLLLNEGEAVDLVSGYVCNTVRGRVLGMLDHTREMQRLVESRPMEPTRNRNPRKGRR